MATLSNGERNAIIDALLTVSEENHYTAGRFLRVLRVSLPAINWDTILRNRAALWQPFIASGLSITAWCDEVIRHADALGA